MNQVEKALALATRLHAGQVDAQGHPYILHPLRAFLAAQARSYDVNMQCAALLHDTMEDCGVTMEDLLAEGMPHDVVTMVEYLTRPSDSCAHPGCPVPYRFTIHQSLEAGLCIEDFNHEWVPGGPEQPYSEFITNITRHPRAARIKLLDIDDNEGRLAGIIDPEKAVRLFRKYRAARQVLEAALIPHGGR